MSLEGVCNNVHDTQECEFFHAWPAHKTALTYGSSSPRNLPLVIAMLLTISTTPQPAVCHFSTTDML
jgi:hypothetical protein